MSIEAYNPENATSALDCDCLQNCEISDSTEHVFHDCETAENLFKQIPIEALNKLYDTCQYITSLTTNIDQKSTKIDNNFLTSSTTIITIKITPKSSFKKTIHQDFTAFRKHPLNGTQIDLLHDDRLNFDHINASTGKIEHFPTILNPFTANSSDESDLETENEDSRFGPMREGKRRKLFAKYSEKSETQANKELAIKKLSEKLWDKDLGSLMTEADLPKNLEPVKLVSPHKIGENSEDPQTQPEFDSLLKTLYLDRENYPLYTHVQRNGKISKKTGIPTVQSEKSYICPYSFCNFNRPNWKKTIEHLETVHLYDTDKNTMTELEYGLKKLYKRRCGQSIFVKEWEREKIWKCPYPDCNFENPRIKVTRQHTVSQN